MKRYIKNSVGIFGMALHKQEAMEKLLANKDALVEHIIKCVIYGNSTGNLTKWVNEICGYLYRANRITVKPNDRKLKESNYEDTIFRSMGDASNDAEVCLIDFYVENNRTQKYPEFEINRDLIERTFKAFNDIKAYMLPVLTTKNELVAKDFYSEIYKIVNEV